MMKVLVADDNLFYARMLEQTLREWGYDVVTAGDGNVAWEVLRGEAAPPLAILDWMMPGLDGLELCRRVRRLKRPQPTYVIVLTAKDGREDVVAGLRAGADDYICKPFDREQLQARIQAGLRIVRLQASLADRVKELEHALSAARRLEVMGQLAGGVAHDFNNLLTVILGGCDLLLPSLWQSPAARELLDMVKGAVERGTSLTRQLLAFSSKQVLDFQAVRLNELVAGLEKLLRRLIREDISLSVDLAADAGCVRADPGQLEQVMMNLVLNARDAMPSGGSLAIQTRNADLAEAVPGFPGPVSPGAYVVLRVADSGCGMDEGVKAHIFEPFFTTKGPGRGTGLGLATVYGVVKQCDGAVQVDSAPGRGTTFTIYLPRAAAPAAPPEAARPPEAVEVSGEETILLVEDEENVRAIARRVLQAHHFRVLEAQDGREALRVSAAWPGPIDLMLTDVVMPHLSGPQVADSLLPARPGMKVMYMSGYTDDAGVRQRGAQEGASFLQKPFSPDALVRKVRQLLDACPAGAPAAGGPAPCLLAQGPDA